MLHNIFIYYLHSSGHLAQEKHYFNHNKICKLGSCFIGKYV